MSLHVTNPEEKLLAEHHIVLWEMEAKDIAEIVAGLIDETQQNGLKKDCMSQRLPITRLFIWHPNYTGNVNPSQKI